MSENRRLSVAPDEVRKSAVLSDDGVYRYELARVWNPDVRPVLFIGFNPSTADAERDDPTIRRCIRFARDWGYGGLLMGNLFAYRATNPKALPDVRKNQLVSPVGEWTDEWRASWRVNRNDEALRHMADRAGLVVAAWGSIKMPFTWEDRPERVRMKLGAMHALAFTKDGHPRHPLYIKADVCPVPMPSIAMAA
jgi:hypothetical protein